MREILEGDEFNHQLLKRADYAGNTAVHLAAIGPEPLILRELLMRGASVHARNRANNTPLYLAEKMGNAECVSLLKEAGGHLWLDNDLKKEGQGSRTASRKPSDGTLGSGTRSEAGDGESALAIGHSGLGGDGEGGTERPGVELGEAESARVVLLSGEKGKIVG